MCVRSIPFWQSEHITASPRHHVLDGCTFFRLTRYNLLLLAAEGGRIMLGAIENILLLLGLASLLLLLFMLPIAMFSPSRFTRPCTVVSVLSFISFASALVWLLLGWGC